MRSVETVEVSADDGVARIDRWLRRRYPQLSQGQVEKLIRTGQVRVDGARVKASDRVSPGQSVRIPPLPDAPPRPPPGALPKKDEDFIRSLVIHRDDDVIVLNKPHGIAVQGGAKTTRHIDGLLDGLKFDAEKKPKLVHRLDRDTSGCLVLARHPRAAAFLGEAFRDRDTDKIYWAIVTGAPRPKVGELRSWMRKAPGVRDADREMMVRAVQTDEGAVHAVTQYAVLSEAGQRASWLALRPVTGRTHQLRFHMAEMGHAIAGDPKYKSDRPTPNDLSGALLLHARALRLPHPSGGELNVTAALPPHMKRAFDLLGFEEREARDPFEPFAGTR
ncbi:MAG TPA: RluA family pseudouridine synthase [Vitreimonas sp.]|uniref:RluA family pseudouridine synthase n=1 Tax=Vitreimonas sp. TaxID=3069702 RepID=UPI002D2876FB|nr:RluA family pseudouridine synthase [Vitreimonas sp.]HYD88351.1 RluA family pseudouridine synthase [Vitreimonas sp.]